MIFDPRKKTTVTLKTKTNELDRVFLFYENDQQKGPIPEDLAVPIVYEDNSLVVFNKPQIWLCTRLNLINAVRSLIF